MLATDYQNYIHLSRYARWDYTKQRRETWSETTVDRYVQFILQHVAQHYPGAAERLRGFKQLVEDSILYQHVMPSMRAMMTAGPALERDNLAAFNCTYRAVDSIRALDEIMYCLLCGSGVGFSVERQSIAKLPTVSETFYRSDSLIIVDDSKLGWCNAFRELVCLLYSGRIPRWDTSNVRPAGSVLKTFGGRASGPEPLEDLFEFTTATIRDAAGRRLNSLELHDIVCKVGEVVVVGGVRRSALISLSNLSDDRMRSAKSGQWWVTNPQRALANNSVAYTEKPEMHAFMREWFSLYESKAGERGIFNREAAQLVAARNGRRDADRDFGTNPCGEILLRNAQCCNLSEVILRPDDTNESVREKVMVATLLGTIQSTFTNFRYLGQQWRENCEEERLLGVSLTGIMDCDRSFLDPAWLRSLRDYAVEVNAEWAAALGINQSTAITCVKPSGTVSQLVDCASGLHPRFSRHYIRRVRGDAMDPLTQFMVNTGFPHERCVNNDKNIVFQFPIESPATSTTADEVSAIDQLEVWELLQDNWCEHKPSCTVYVREYEWLAVGDWVYQKFNKISGVSFLPYTEHNYRQAPYEAIDETAYMEMLAKMPKNVDWSYLNGYEQEDYTTGSQELACVAGACEVA